MKLPVLLALVLLSLLAFHSVQGAALETSKEETTMANYEARSEAFNNQFLNLNKMQSLLKSDDFLNWHAIMEAVKRAFPFFNWEAFPKLKGLRSATPDEQ
ncbi:PREDICTED: keratinocyte differentiation-associated protein isoform X1 [Dipodomys ordii]|uniref:Keratinocyte differentiation-associated protein isoform X1 n=1 Tax=Dipodomys ordii TaxID=10020 RepID=A0A1S3FYU3_DIPOR|nr:PREDICTED: keratinocyte differentiation-associated protein isoform X1 [Dipodomys ordii]